MRTRIGFARLGVDADVDQRIVGASPRPGLHGFFEAAMMLVAAIELLDEVEPLALAARDLVEVLLHFGRELDVDEIAEMRDAADA